MLKRKNNAKNKGILRLSTNSVKAGRGTPISFISTILRSSVRKDDKSYLENPLYVLPKSSERDTPEKVKAASSSKKQVKAKHTRHYSEFFPHKNEQLIGKS